MARHVKILKMIYNLSCMCVIQVAFRNRAEHLSSTGILVWSCFIQKYQIDFLPIL